MNTGKQIITLNHKYAQAYIVCVNGIYIMVDAGYPESFNTFGKILSMHSITYSQIKYLIITHFHPDHAGLVQPLMDLGIQLIMHENQKGYIEWMNNYFVKHYTRNKGVPHKKYQPITKEGTLLSTESSEKLFAGNKIAGKIISTPGHSDDSITFIIDDIAFTGDLPRYDLMSLYKSEIILNSWDKILKNKVKEIYPGHGINYLLK
jgi:glyoxylase-like metal-dependent hydrolase (beta-lactamase superfamily II)